MEWVGGMTGTRDLGRPSPSSTNQGRRRTVGSREAGKQGGRWGAEKSESGEDGGERSLRRRPLSGRAPESAAARCMLPGKTFPSRLVVRVPVCAAVPPRALPGRGCGGRVGEREAVPCLARNEQAGKAAMEWVEAIGGGRHMPPPGLEEYSLVSRAHAHGPSSSPGHENASPWAWERSRGRPGSGGRGIGRGRHGSLFRGQKSGKEIDHRRGRSQKIRVDEIIDELSRQGNWPPWECQCF
jgi:hypothetical protein